MTLELSWLTRPEEVQRLSDEWDALLRRGRCNLAFDGPAWFTSELRCFGGEPRVAIARRSGALIGVLPLSRGREEGRVTLGFSGMMADYHDLVGDPADEELLQELLAFALSSEEYDELRLSNVRRDSNCVRALRLVDPELDLARVYRVSDCCPFIALAGTFEDFLRGKSSGFRKGVRRALEGAAGAGVEVREVAPGGALSGDALAEHFLFLQRQRFPAGLFSLPAPECFVRRVFPILFEERRMRAFVVTRGDEVLGIAVYMVGAGSLCGWGMGFREEAACWMPGKLLVIEGIRRAHEDGLKEYDFLRGAEEYKDRWKTDARDIGCITFHREAGEIQVLGV